MKLLIAEKRLVIETNNGEQFVLVRCEKHDYHIKPITEVRLSETPRELAANQVMALMAFVHLAFIEKK